MIKLERNITPIKLNPKLVKDKTEAYKKEGKSVWNIPWLKEALLQLSHNKCAYCECLLTKESKYMEVEHFEDKYSNPEKVLEWDNLLPSCKRCNGFKSGHDVIKEPIINPFIDIPNKEMYFHLYRYEGITCKGKKTIEIINLNHLERAVKVRFEVGEALQILLENIIDKIESYEREKKIVQRNKLINAIEQLYEECQPYSQYAATCATVLMGSESYYIIRNKLEEFNIWNSNFEIMEKTIRELAFEMR